MQPSTTPSVFVLQSVGNSGDAARAMGDVFRRRTCIATRFDAP
ncbi:hypothetical protein C7S16_4678 [Burkholderia thailandensis]|uniref:Uncharacterized protein n=1 Tax=Burkholderia thailandensis TaxID=57975 RepID=A0AAW9CQ20_BURTH|nr:hypothetical protein [Burkholderia thailandensis]